MSTTATALTVLTFLLIALPAAHRLIIHLQRAESTCDRLIREAHERAETARRMDPITLATADPELAAGRDRLLDAIREHREEEK